MSDVGGDQPVYNIHSLRELVSGSMSRQRVTMLLLVAFAALALLLAFVGTYAVISYSTSLRAHEIGIRVALGAAKRDILRMVLTQGLRLALVGVVAGTAMALVLTRFMSGFSSLLFGVRADDPVTLIAVSLLLVSATLAASYVPASRAARRATTAALRDDWNAL